MKRSALRRAAALLCALALTVQLAPSGARAAASVYLTAANENVLELSDETMPFWSGDYLYVASSLFSSATLGLSYTYNRSRRLLVIWQSSQPSRALFFTLDDGMVSSGEGNNYSPGALMRNGRVFVPVSVMADYFGLSYTVIKVPYGHLVWVRTPDSALSSLTGAMFADAASYQLAARYAQYQKALETEEPVPDSQEPPAAATEGKSVYLCFRVTSQSQTSDVLDALDQEGATATFYLTRDQISRSGDLLRRMIATGHAVGLIADGSVEASLTDQLRWANDALWRAVGGKSRLCLAERTDDSGRAEIASAGYCCLAPDLDRASDGLYTASNANYLFGRVSARGGPVSIWLSDQISSVGVRSFARAAAGAGDRLLGLTETV